MAIADQSMAVVWSLMAIAWAPMAIRRGKNSIQRRPALIHGWPIAIRWYGVLMASAMALGLWLGHRDARGPEVVAADHEQHDVGPKGFEHAR